MSKSYILSRMDWAKAYRDYEELKVGRANEIIGSEIKPNGRWTPNNNVTLSFSNNELEITFNLSNTSSHGAFLDTRDMILDEGIYTLTIEADMSNLSDSSRLGVAFVNGEGVIASNPSRIYQLPYKGSRSFFEVTFEVSTPIKHARILIFASPIVNAGEKLKVYSAKIEKGSVSTPYTPHPSDINSQPYPAQVAQDMYQATEGNWVKAEQDYELLKVGKANLLPNKLEQVIYNLQPYQHSKNIGFYSATIIKDIPTNGRLLLSPHIKVERGEKYSLSVNFSEQEDNMIVIYCYNKNGEIIIDKETIDKNLTLKGTGILHTPVYLGYTFRSQPKTPKVGVDIIGEDVASIRLSFGTYQNTNTTKDTVLSNWKLERGDTSTPFTPSPQSINASPFTVKLANDYYQQQEEITELRNAILQLGGK